jgi:hypothetical protein
MNRLREYLCEIGIRITSWDGAGACAAAVLQMMKVKESMQEQLPDDCYRIQKRAYSGGRVEIGRTGVYIGPV